MQLKDKSIIPRYYQTESAKSALISIKKKDSNPIIALTTGAGKTITICLIIIERLKENPTKRILVVSHVKEILDQNYKELEKQLDDKIGIYSSGLGRKDTEERVIVVGMQSGRNNPEVFKDVDLIIIDECHLINSHNEGTYREFLSNFKVNCIGLTATPFRHDGYLHLHEESLFTEICYSTIDQKGFNKLTEEGFITPIYSKATDLKFEIPKGVRTTAGDWNTKDLSICFNNDQVTEKAVKETVEILNTGKYKKVLVFCIDIKHAERVSNHFNEAGFKSDFVHSKMTNDRDEVFKKFRKGEIQILTNVSMATTGLDVPDIDMLILLRNTKSASLYSQMVGRALRIAEGKTHALILDFANNINTLGPVNDLQIDQKGKPKKGGDAPVKECPECKCHNHPIAKYCKACGYKFKFKIKLTETSSELSITKRKKPQELTVRSVTYNRHKKKGKPNSFRIDYMVGLRKYHSWLSVEASSLYAANKAKFEIPKMLKDGKEIDGNFTVNNLLAQQDKFKTPIKIIVDTNEKYPQIEEVIYE